MTQTDTKMEHQIFCLPSNKLYYGLELDSIIETVQNVQITPIPCLPEYYCGVCNHKGTVVPVLSRTGWLAVPEQSTMSTR